MRDEIEHYIHSAQLRGFRDGATSAKNAETIKKWIWASLEKKSSSSVAPVSGDESHLIPSNSLLQIAWSIIAESTTSESYPGEKMDILFCFTVELCYSCLTQQLRSVVSLWMQSIGRNSSIESGSNEINGDSSWLHWMEQRDHLFTPVNEAIDDDSNSRARDSTWGASNGHSPSLNHFESAKSASDKEMEPSDDEDDVSLLTTPHIEAESQEVTKISTAEMLDNSVALDVSEQEHYQACSKTLVKLAQTDARRILNQLFSNPSRLNYSMLVCLQDCSFTLSSSPSPLNMIFEAKQRKSIHLPSGRFIALVHGSAGDIWEGDLGWFSQTVLKYFVDKLLTIFDDSFCANQYPPRL